MFSNLYVEQFVTDRLRERRAAAVAFRTARLATRAVSAGRRGNQAAPAAPAIPAVRVDAPALVG